MATAMMTMRRAAALGARHIPPAAAFSRHMSADASAAMEKIRAAGLLKTQGLIAGQWVDAYDGKTIEVQNPATGEVLANVSFMGSRETSDAIASAHSTFYFIVSTVTQINLVLYDLIISHKEELALLMTLEQGKPMKEALGEVNYGASFIEYFAEEAKRIYGDIIPPTLSDRRLLVLKQAIC
ncbi:Succinate-semialdehyde dehydrogenase mitochondrial [Zea mays]|uniref:Succinate-semialdehyde dehydrogenase mitochondrial n=1 Tax=Zea mays TaxID=4577 RepID=A0A1D6H1M7_MAIZE|nr:Succinate-semialdehyde dehydrogenase mitochondrial [Zea mays]